VTQCQSGCDGKEKSLSLYRQHYNPADQHDTFSSCVTTAASAQMLSCMLPYIITVQWLSRGIQGLTDLWALI
jgi:hypothetical protein